MCNYEKDHFYRHLKKNKIWFSFSGTTVTVGVGEDGLQTLSSDGATLAMQQVMMGGHSEDDDEEEEDDDEDEDDDPSHTDMTRLGLETSDSL